jgi:hypothetical protein
VWVLVTYLLVAVLRVSYYIYIKESTKRVEEELLSSIFILLLP